MNKEVRVRFAPSPTGEPHIGNIRTVVFNWLFARQNNGKFIIRIEDTDRERYQPETVKVITDSLKWLNLDWDEGPEVGGPFGPYIQSERVHLYKKAAEDLLKSGHAYRCNCTPERLKQVREEREKQGLSGYDRHCRDLPPEAIRPEETHVVRLKVPLEGKTVIKDIIKGEIVVENSHIQDQVLLKSDGFPTYHLAVVVDDNEMKISHIIRGDDWVSTAPIHVLLYKAFGYEIPAFCHVPLVIAEDGKKLAKRHGATSISEFKAGGYLPEALFNFLALLGWAPSEGDTQEVFTREELIKKFDLHRVSRSKACFSYKKLDWINGIYIRNMKEEELLEKFIPLWQDAGFLEKPWPSREKQRLLKITGLLKERVKNLNEVIEKSEFIFKGFTLDDSKKLLGKNLSTEESIKTFERVYEEFARMEDFTEPSIQAKMEGLLTELNQNPKQLYSMMRWAVTGSKASPPIFGSIEVVGKEKTLERVKKAIEDLKSLQ